MAAVGLTRGSWLVAMNTHCFCRGGVPNVGGSTGTQPGGTSN
jgi:hypothetical protein